MGIVLPYMVRHGEQQHVTEDYVSVPPALTITDECGALWTLGFRSGVAPRGEFAFNVLRNGVETGDIASRIERRRSGIRIFTAGGWKSMPTAVVDETRVYGIGARHHHPERRVTVTVSFDDQLDPVCVFVCEACRGGLWDGKLHPIVCVTGRWLYATGDPPELTLKVMASLGMGGTLRQIPVRMKSQ